MSKNKCVLVVDDETAITNIVSSYLEKAGYETVCAHDGRAALELFDRHAPVLVILDLMLPGLSGEQVCTALRKQSRVPVIMLTAKTAEGDALQGLGLGADDYVRKPFSPRELMARVEAVMRRVSAAPEPLASALVFHEGSLVIDAQRHEARKHGERIPLTSREFAILSALAAHPTKVFSRDELIALALGEDYDGLDRSIDTHIKNIRQKIETEGHKYIRTVHGVGYAFEGE
jgi:DNA-binding response OmpR family regulator